MSTETQEREKKIVEFALSSFLDLPDRRERPLGGEASLMLEQLEQGIRGAGKGDSQDLRWLYSTARDHIYAFEVICDVLDFSAEFIRARVEEHRNGGRPLKAGRVQRLPARTQVVAA